MPSKSASTRQEQLKNFESAIARRIDLLKTKGDNLDRMVKDPILRHLKGKAKQARKSLNAISDIQEKTVRQIKRKEKGKKKKEKEEE